MPGVNGSAGPAPLIWMDMEMSGLDPDACRILEVATLVTDGDLNVIAEGPELVVHQPDEVLAAMDEWNTRTHGGSGLTALVRASTVTVAEAEAQTLAFLQQHTEHRASPLCGTAVFQDRRFIERYMPQLYEFLHYRLVDVATVRELALRWVPQLQVPARQELHRARADVLESLAEMRAYRSGLFR